MKSYHTVLTVLSSVSSGTGAAISIWLQHTCSSILARIRIAVVYFSTLFTHETSNTQTRVASIPVGACSSVQTRFRRSWACVHPRLACHTSISHGTMTHKSISVCSVHTSSTVKTWVVQFTSIDLRTGCTMVTWRTLAYIATSSCGICTGSTIDAWIAQFTLVDIGTSCTKITFRWTLADEAAISPRASATIFA